MKRFVLVILIAAAALLSACHSQTEQLQEDKLSEPPAVTEKATDESSDASAGNASSGNSVETDGTGNHKPETSADSSKGQLSIQSHSEETPAPEKESPSYSPQNEASASECPESQTLSQDSTSGTGENHVSSSNSDSESEQPSEPEPEQSVFDISNWIAYAREYGQTLGLTYDETAIDCWDNPIIASGRSQSLERDIRSRLELYQADGMIYFCVWAEPRADGAYDLYIGYA